MSELDHGRIAQIVDAIAERLDGDWLLIGGALVALWLEPRRVTEDIDVIGLGERGDERYRLMDLADGLGLPVEAVNSAADFFVRRIDGWREQLEVLQRGARGTVYRPTPTLFLLLKIGRLTARDLEDCRALIARSERDALVVDRARVLAALAALPDTTDEPLRGRRDALAGALAART